MLKRKIYEKLVLWKNSHSKECLVINGARQIGKTFIIDYFGRENYKSYIYINLFRNPEYEEIFEGNIDSESILNRLPLFNINTKIVEGDTLLFIDEIQRSPKARTALKFLAMDDRIDVIASGSLLGINYRRLNQSTFSEISIPVGYEKEINMHSLDLEEFLWAKGITSEAIEALRQYYNNKTKIPSAVNTEFSNLLREYMVVGGMPAVVNKYLETNSLEIVHDEQQKIFNSYDADITQYATNSERPKIRGCLYSLPRQLARENTKFKFSEVSKGGNARKYENSLDWLQDAGLISLLRNVTLPEIPLRAYEIPDQFKVYGNDIGMIASMFGYETQKALLNNTLTGHAKGGIYENLIFDILNKKGLILNYYRKGEGMQEIEFIFEKDGSVIPIEVKSRRGETISLNEFIKQFNPKYSIKLIDGNIGVENSKITMPHYMALFI